MKCGYQRLARGAAGTEKGMCNQLHRDRGRAHKIVDGAFPIDSKGLSKIKKLWYLSGHLTFVEVEVGFS